MPWHIRIWRIGTWHSLPDQTEHFPFIADRNPDCRHAAAESVANAYPPELDKLGSALRVDCPVWRRKIKRDRRGATREPLNKYSVESNAGSARFYRNPYGTVCYRRSAVSGSERRGPIIRVLDFSRISSRKAAVAPAEYLFRDSLPGSTDGLTANSQTQQEFRLRSTGVSLLPKIPDSLRSLRVACLLQSYVVCAALKIDLKLRHEYG